MASNREAFVSDCFEWNDGVLVWNPGFRISFFEWEVELISSLRALLEGCYIKRNGEDKRLWIEEPSGTFSVKSFYKSIMPISNPSCSAKRIAEEFGIPLLPAYLVSRSKEQDFRGGANFAVAGGTALDAAFFAERGIEDLSTNYSMGVQLNWFMELLPTLCPDSSNCRDMLRRSLFLMGEFGGNDYSLVYQKGWSTPELHTVVSQITTAISSAVDMLIEHGATTVMVPGTLPIGCFLTIFGRPSKDNYEPLTGCRKDLNELVSYHNQQLQKELDWMRDKHPNAIIIYVDYYNAALPVFGSPYQFGFSKGAFVACCGGGGPYNFNSSAPCGSPWAKAFNNTSLYWNWDGRHPTEAGNRMITTGLIEGPYTIPPITSSCPSLASENVNHPHYE
ncbi:GDSL esterase/lipase At1g28590-like [Tasmannia lanceolata]|uniref:GDSL esterase/lipase At1g28590-like n=1 Tax=Tasmannia lanceolata TaxID=3420 RepID=UPI0040648450